MHVRIKRYIQSTVVLLTLLTMAFPVQTRAQSYPIDCAILLCLAGGWPDSAPCLSARGEFLRRVTPWPIEPPLQIWRCPMQASTPHSGTPTDHQWIVDALFRDETSRIVLQVPTERPNIELGTKAQFLRLELGGPVQPPALQYVQNREYSGYRQPIDFLLHHLRVFHVRYARQNNSGDDVDCDRAFDIRIGRYDEQSSFWWAQITPSNLPERFQGLEGWGDDCPSLFHRSVFVEWRDSQGGYGYQQIDY